MPNNLKEIGFLVLWAVVVLFFVRPVPGKGLPIGRRVLRGYLNGPQSVVLGGFLVLVGIVVIFTRIGAESNDALIGFCILWLGLPYVYHGSRFKMGQEASLWETLTRRVRPRP